MMQTVKESRYIRLSIIIIMIFVLVMSNAAISVAEKEKKVVRVGFFPLTGFNEISEHGKVTGYNTDFLKRISEYTGWEYDYVRASDWNEALRMLKNKEIDILAPAQKTLERQNEFLFSMYAMGTEYGSLLTLKSKEELIYEDFKTFSDLKIGCVSTVVFREPFFRYAKENGFTPNITYFENTPELVAALNSGKVDAIVANLMVLKKNMKVLARFAPERYYYMMNSHNYEMHHELNDAIEQIKVNDPNFENALTEKYFPQYKQSPFSKEELEFIQNSPSFRVGCLTNYDPVSYADKKTGQIKGITRDVLDKVSEISGLKFEYVPLPEGKVGFKYLEEANLDLISPVEYNELNISLDIMKISHPYLEARKVFVGRRGNEFSKEKRTRVALATGSQTIEGVVKTNYPNFEFIVYDNIEECMEAVISGDVDILMQNQYTVNKYLSMPQYEKLQIIPQEGLEDVLCFASIIGYNPGTAREGRQSTLISILNKSLFSISNDDMSKIIIGQTAARPYRLTASDVLYKYRVLIAFSVVMLCVAGLLGIYTSRLRRNSLELIKANEKRLKNITDNIRGGVIVVLPDKNFRISYANEGFLSMINQSRQEIEKNMPEYTRYIHEADVELFRQLCQKAFEEKGTLSMKLRILRGDGSFVHSIFNGMVSENFFGETELYCVIMDITEEIRILEKLELEQERYTVIMEKSEALIFEFDISSKKVITSNRFHEKFGWSLPKILSGMELSDLWPINFLDRNDFDNVLDEVLNGSGDGQCKVRILKADGIYIWCEISFHMIKRGDMNSKVVGTVTDIDQEVKEKQLLLQKSQLDSLTGLLNKESFKVQAKKYLYENPSKNSALAFIDLDNFKKINDLMGHMKGDEAIKDVARKLEIIFSHADIISRFGGDEFCVLITDIPAETLKDKLSWAVEKMRDIYENKMHRLDVSASFGIACTYDCGNDLNRLMECADKALYSAKENGKDKCVFYHDRMRLNGYTGRKE